MLQLYELALLGSGQMLKAGPLTLRMLFFILSLLLSFSIVIISKKVEKYFISLLLIYTVLLITGIVMAIVNRNEVGLVLEDLKPLIFFYCLLFFAQLINSDGIIADVRNVLRRSAIILAVGYILMLFGLFSGILNYQTLYISMNNTGEFFFRGTSGFFYKGFLYMCVGVFFYIDKFSFKNILVISLLITALILTFTRGFLLSMFIVLFIYLIAFSNRKFVTLIVLLIGSIPLYLYLPTYMEALGDKSTSNNERYIQICDVKNEVDPFSIVIGHGFGGGVASRPVHMEISYLEIFHKQGLLGLAFWFGVMAAILFSYAKASAVGNKQEALPYLLSSLFVFLQSFTNPFINNPIGMSIILISLVVLKRLQTRKLNVINAKN